MSFSRGKILLVDPPWYGFFEGNKSNTPLGLCSIAAVLEKNGFDVSVYNADFNQDFGWLNEREITQRYEDYLRQLDDLNSRVWQAVGKVLERQEPEIVGLSVLTPKYGSALNLSKLVKQLNPGTKVIWGGVHPTICPEDCLKNPEVDFVVRGEGEYTVLELAKAIWEGKPLEDMKGISYRKNERIFHNEPRELIENLDELPFPARHLVLEKEKMSPSDFNNIFATRGCPYNCIFCASNMVWGRRVRYRSAENVVKEIKEIKEKYKTSYFWFDDDSFSINKNYVGEICALIAKENLKITWGCETRVDLVTDELIKCMRKVGCRVVTIGVESGNNEILRKIKKHITVEQTKKAVRILKQNKLEVKGFFLIGFPWESETEINDTINLMKELDLDHSILSIATPYYGTELYELCRERGILPEKMNWSDFFHQSPEMHLAEKISKERFEELVKEAERLFGENNKAKERKKLLNPIYVLTRIIQGKFYQPRRFLGAVKYLMP